MINYNLKLALKSIRRNPIMTGLMVAAIGVGIGVSMTTLTVHYMMSGNPIPEKNDVLFAITIDSWNPLRPFDDDRPERGPHQLTFHDAERLVGFAKAKRQTAMFESSLIIEPLNDDDLPFEAGARVANSDFFAMFNVPFLYGSGWDKSADDNEEYVQSKFQAFMEKNQAELGWTGQFTDPNVPNSIPRLREINKACELVLSITKQFPEPDRKGNSKFQSEIKAGVIRIIDSVPHENRPEFIHFIANNLGVTDKLLIKLLQA